MLNTTLYEGAGAEILGVRRWIGAAGLVSLALGIGPSTAAITFAYSMLTMFALLTWREIRALWNAGWASKALLFLTLYVLAQSVIIGLTQEQPAFSGHDLWHFVRTISLGTLLSGWTIYACRMSPRILCSLFVVGVGVATLEAYLEHGWALFSLSRMNYLRSPNELGLFGGTIFLVAFFFGGSKTMRLWHNQSQAAAVLAAAVGTLFLVVTGLWLWIQSGSRSSWIGLLAGLGIILLPSALVAARRRHSVMSFGLGIIFVTTVIAALVIIYADKIHSRIEPELASLSAIKAGDIDSLIDGRQAGHNPRFKIWAVAMTEIGEKPIVGWGSGSLTSHFALAVQDGTLRAGRGHYHSLYLHLAVFIGLPFAALALAAYGNIFGRSASSLVRKSGNSKELGWFIATWGLYFAIASLFQVRMHSAYGAAFFILFSGMAYGIYLQTQLNETERQHQKL